MLTFHDVDSLGIMKPIYLARVRATERAAMANGVVIGKIKSVLQQKGLALRQALLLPTWELI